MDEQYIKLQLITVGLFLIALCVVPIIRREYLLWRLTKIVKRFSKRFETTPLTPEQKRDYSKLKKALVVVGVLSIGFIALHYILKHRRK